VEIGRQTFPDLIGGYANRFLDGIDGKSMVYQLAESAPVEDVCPLDEVSQPPGKSLASVAELLPSPLMPCAMTK
jgi:hypothetical protein